MYLHREDEIFIAETAGMDRWTRLSNSSSSKNGKLEGIGQGHFDLLLTVTSGWGALEVS